MSQSSPNTRLSRAADKCDELTANMADIQQRLENRRSRMNDNIERIKKGLNKADEATASIAR